MRFDEPMDHSAAMLRARTPGELVWHYTNLDTLSTILQTNSVLATEVSFQNDIRETSTADAAFREALEKMLDEKRFKRFAREALRFLDDEDNWRVFLPSVTQDLTRNARFILCASNDPDSLYSWRTYSQHGIGCAIGIDPLQPLGVVDQQPSPHRIRHWRRVVYSPAQTRAEARKHLVRMGEEWITARAPETEKAADDAIGIVVTKLAEARSMVRSLAKDPAFKDEDEQRVTDETVSYSALMTTSSSMGPRPQVRLVASDNGQWGKTFPSAHSAPKLPIRAIRLGPNAPDSAMAATQWLLLANGYPVDPLFVDEEDVGPHSAMTWERSVVLDRSTHPYRSR